MCFKGLDTLTASQAGKRDASSMALRARSGSPVTPSRWAAQTKLRRFRVAPHAAANAVKTF